jgi:hypothetical protein
MWMAESPRRPLLLGGRGNSSHVIIEEGSEVVAEPSPVFANHFKFVAFER